VQKQENKNTVRPNSKPLDDWNNKLDNYMKNQRVRI
jgi:hypothetical protein